MTSKQEARHWFRIGAMVVGFCRMGGRVQWRTAHLVALTRHSAHGPGPLFRVNSNVYFTSTRRRCRRPCPCAPAVRPTAREHRKEEKQLPTGQATAISVRCRQHRKAGMIYVYLPATNEPLDSEAGNWKGARKAGTEEGKKHLRLFWFLIIRGKLLGFRASD